MDLEAYSLQVLISYYIQALLLFLLAAACIVSAAVQTWRLRRKPTVMGNTKLIEGNLENFLTTQCYFGGKDPMLSVADFETD